VVKNAGSPIIFSPDHEGRGFFAPLRGGIEDGEIERTGYLKALEMKKRDPLTFLENVFGKKEYQQEPLNGQMDDLRLKG